MIAVPRNIKRNHRPSRRGDGTRHCNEFKIIPGIRKKDKYSLKKKKKIAIFSDCYYYGQTKYLLINVYLYIWNG